MITGEDLVKWQFLVAEGKPLPLSQADIEAKILERGHAIEARIYAENPAMGFIPTSGLLTHLQPPKSTDMVRVDGGFVAGDEISAHYDPMISKLIVRGVDRKHAIRELDHALQEYQVAGIPSNISFLRRVCQNETFIQGDVETGFIEKQKDQLFTKDVTADEVFVQAALSVLLSDARRSTALSAISEPGFIEASGRSIEFHTINADGSPSQERVFVNLRETTNGLYDAQIGDNIYTSLLSSWHPVSKTLTTFFPQKRVETTIIQNLGNMTIFQQGQEHHISIAVPSWTSKALGVKEAKHSILTPMPCKVLRVDVAEGQDVKKNQALVVIESMKMETTIRSPKDAKVSRIVHQKGVWQSVLSI